MVELGQPFNNITTVGGTFFGNTATNSTITGLRSIGGGTSQGSFSQSDWENSTWYQQVTATENANVINIDLCRLGFVTIKGNTTTTTLTNNDVIQNIQLTKYDDGFLYNDIPTNQLSKINLWIPVKPN